VAALYFANRLVQLPLALFGVASAQASLPTLAEQAATRRLQEFRATLLTVLRMVACVTIPSAVGLAVLAMPIVQVCLERGAFDRASTVMTAQTLALFAVGLVAYAASKVLTGAFYALHDTTTPVRLAVEALGVNIVLALLCVGPLRVGGLALATALASSLNAWRLLRRLEERLDMPLAPNLARPILRMSVAALIMGMGCWIAWSVSQPAVQALLALPVVIIGGILLYAGSCALLGVPEPSRLLRWLVTLRSPRPSGSG
jgi:putative peptidoglycan lipid II flippase